MTSQLPSAVATIYNYLTSVLGFTPAGASAALGNFDVETGGTFSPGAYNPGEGAIGIAQWEGGRRTALDAYAARTGGTETSLTTQLGYLGQELNGSYSRVLAAMRTATDPAAAAAYWDVGPGGVNSGTGFENSSGSATGTRQADAQSIYSQIASGTLPGLNGRLTGGASTAGSAQGIVGSSGAQTAAGGGTWYEPWTWGKYASGAVSEIGNLVIKSVFTVAGLGLTVGGLIHAAQPIKQKIQPGDLAALAAL